MPELTLNTILAALIVAFGAFVQGASGFAFGLTTMGALPFDGDEICPPDALADLDDTEPEFEEATGNEGVSFERFYQRAALILWPRAGRAGVVADGGLDVSVPFLGELVRHWEEGGQAQGYTTRQEALDLAAQISQAWPTHDWERKQASKMACRGRIIEEGR